MNRVSPGQAKKEMKSSGSDARAILHELASRWSTARAAERANAQSYLKELCRALGIEEPRPAGSGYEFEFPVKVVGRDGSDSTNFIDLFKVNSFALEAKDEDTPASNDRMLRKAFGQVRTYAAALPGERPPYILVLDVAKVLLIWDRWSGDYGGFSAGRRIDLRSLAENDYDQILLRSIWNDPASLDPRGKAVAVTREVAAQLARLASSLESRGHGQDRVARFLMRSVFTMFAEDVGLLPGHVFHETVEKAGIEGSAEEFSEAVTELWRAMDKGGRFGLKKFLRFNGHFFRDAESLPLTDDELKLLLGAAQADWQDVEPSIFGTLLVRALDPEERHRLGAEFTPRAYVERVVRPTVEEPIRERWTAVQAEVLQLLGAPRKQDRAVAARKLREFHAWLRGLRFLDPACGSGNFLYVTMHAVKRIEFEVISLLHDIEGGGELRLDEVGPWQFHGIEVKEWAREIAELTLWIGFHQFWKSHHSVQPPEPILKDTGTLEFRDAALAWDSKTEDPSRARPDPTPRISDPVTGRLVPDPKRTLSYVEYRGARPAKWPRADFIVGNPPYLGQGRQREAFGDGYVDALRGAYPELPDSVDYVMYWWYRAAREVAAGRTIRAGLITTNTIVQPQNRAVIAEVSERGARVAWAVPDHPWVDGTDAAAVRVAMTVIAREPEAARLVTVDESARVVREEDVARLNADLTAHADVATAAGLPLRANTGLASPGFKLHGAGFILEAGEANKLVGADSSLSRIIRPYLNGRDLTSRPRGVFVIDFATRGEAEARETPVLFDLVRSRVKPERDANNDRSTREKWWRFGRNREEIRPALAELSRFIATPETAKHRFFVFLDHEVAPDNMLIVIALDDPFALGVLSSRIHVLWALAAGGTLEDRPRYNKTVCFDPFPFPDAPPALRRQIATVAENLDRHRKEALARAESVTMTGMYNVVEKLRTGEALSATEQEIHLTAACGVLRDLHDSLDQMVARAYGWEWALADGQVLDRIVRLHDERVGEEGSGKVRWLRPEYQAARFAAPGELELPLAAGSPDTFSAKRGRAALRLWPESVVDQVIALKSLLATDSLTADAAMRRFRGARRDLVARHLETLALMGEVHEGEGGRYFASPVSVP